MEKIRIEQHSSLGLIWIGGWLFTLGYFKLTFWQGVVALFVFIGAALAQSGWSTRVIAYPL